MGGKAAVAAVALTTTTTTTLLPLLGHDYLIVKKGEENEETGGQIWSQMGHIKKRDEETEGQIWSQHESLRSDRGLLLFTLGHFKVR